VPARAKSATIFPPAVIDDDGVSRPREEQEGARVVERRIIPATLGRDFRVPVTLYGSGFGSAKLNARQRKWARTKTINHFAATRCIVKPP